MKSEKRIEQKKKGIEYLKPSIFFSFLISFIFIFVFLPLTSADISDSSLVQTSNDISSSFSGYSTCVNKQGSGGIQFDSSGTYVYMTPCLPDVASHNNDYILQFRTGTAYDISTLTFMQRMNVNMSSGDFASFYLAPDGINLYTGYQNTSSSARWHIRHYKLSEAWNITSAELQQQEYYTDGSGGSSGFGTLWITEDGTKLIHSKLSSFYSGGSTKVINLSIAFNLSGTQTLKYQGSPPSNVGNATRGIAFSNNGLIAFVAGKCGSSNDLNYNVKQYQINSSLPYDVSSLVLNNTLDITDITDASCAGRGKTGIFYWNDGYRNYFIDTASHTGGTFVYKYSFSSLDSEAPTDVNTTTGYKDSIIDPILSIFPDKDDLTFKQKMGFVFITMLLVAVVLIYGASHIENGISEMMTWIIVAIEIGVFIFFVAIGYINAGILILLTLISLALGYFKLKGGGGNG